MGVHNCFCRLQGLIAYNMTCSPGIDSHQSLAGTSTKFGDCLLQIDTQSGWCHAVAWSPSGESLLASGCVRLLKESVSSVSQPLTSKSVQVHSYVSPAMDPQYTLCQTFILVT